MILAQTVTFDDKNAIRAQRQPKPSCKHCHGRGYEGVRVDVPGTRLWNVCRCVGRWKPVPK